MENEGLIPVEQLCSSYNIEHTFINSLRDYGLIELIIVEGRYCLLNEQLRDLEKIIRLHYELDINLEGIDAISHLLKRVDEMQTELSAVRNRLRLYETGME